MPHPIATTFIALLTCAIVLPAAGAAPPADSPPWVSLFNGRDLFGWKLVGDKGRAEVRDGAIICRQTPHTREHTFVCSEQRYDDFGNTWQWLHTLENDPRARAAFNYNDWNRLRIEAIGTVLKVWVNDVSTTHLQCAKYARGFVALKIRSLAAQSPEQESYRGSFRSIRIITENPGRYARPINLTLTTVP